MGFSDLIADRYSVRSYTNKKVEKEKLDIILEAGRVAPSAANKRPIKLIVVQSEEGLTKAKKTLNAFGAPLLIIVCGNLADAAVRDYDKKNFADVDTSIVLDHMMLQAVDLGLGTLWIGGYDPKVLHNEFNISEPLEAIGVLAVGYTDEKPLSRADHAKKYKSIEELVVYETL